MSSWSTPETPIVSTDWLLEHLNSPDLSQLISDILKDK